MTGRSEAAELQWARFALWTVQSDRGRSRVLRLGGLPPCESSQTSQVCDGRAQAPGRRRLFRTWCSRIQAAQLFWVGLATPGPQEVGGRRQGGVDDGSRPDEVEGPGVKQDVRHAEVADACKNLTEYGAECGRL